MESIYDAPKGETERTWALVRQVSTLMDRLLEQRLLKFKLTPERVAVLRVLGNNKGYTTIIAELARELCRRPQTVVGAVNRMVAEGLLRRIPKRKGRPYTEVILTERGEKAREAGQAVVEKVLADTERWLSANERRTTNHSLSMMQKGLADKLHIEVLERPE